MDGIPEVCLAAFCLLHIFGVGQDRLEAIMLQDVIDRDPVFPGGLHADVFHAVASELFGHPADVAVGRGELPDIEEGVEGRGVCPADRGHEDLFMDIKARADRAPDVGSG